MENYKNSKTGQGDRPEICGHSPYGAPAERRIPAQASAHDTSESCKNLFSPFAALRGYDEQLAEEKQRTERVTKRILTEEEMSDLSDKLNHQYIDLLNGDGLASDKFWELNRRIREDR